MKPTYVKVPVQAVERIKFWESEKLAMIVSQHAEEKEKILAENAGLRSMMGLEEANSPAVETMRETEDGVNRALLLSAVEEIKQLRTRITVLEGEAAEVTHLLLGVRVVLRRGERRRCRQRADVQAHHRARAVRGGQRPAEVDDRREGQTNQRSPR
jgi:hypothetical protein